MAGNPDDFPPELSPPTIARSLLAMAAEATDRHVLLGDLEEEFSFRSKQSPAAARRWYWSQATSSAPHLFLKRLRSEQFRKFGIGLAAVFGAFCLMVVWEIVIAPQCGAHMAGDDEC